MANPAEQEGQRGRRQRSTFERYFIRERWRSNNGDRSLAEQQAAEEAARRERILKIERMARSIDNMRGWALTVATLLVGMAFQAALAPPTWVPKDHWFSALFGLATKGSSFTMGQARKAFAHLFFNTLTFAVALTLVLLLMIPKRDDNEPPQLRIVKLIRIATGLLTVAVTRPATSPRSSPTTPASWAWPLVS
ncbi:hypothetical protein ACP4OV_006755 [Aristida adscensionis]